MNKMIALFLLFPFSVMATLVEEPKTETKQAPQVRHKKSHKHLEIPFLIIGIGGTVCWFKCEYPKPKDEPPPNPGPALITPDNLSDKPTFYQFRSR